MCGSVILLLAGEGIPGGPCLSDVQQCDVVGNVQVQCDVMGKTDLSQQHVFSFYSMPITSLTVKGSGR